MRLLLDTHIFIWSADQPEEPYLKTICYKTEVLEASAKIMKKTSVRQKGLAAADTLRSEYRFDYSKSQPNRFAAKMAQGTVAVVLEPDVVEISRSGITK